MSLEKQMAGSSIYDVNVLYEMICSAQKGEVKRYNHWKSRVKNNIIGGIIYQFQGNSSIFNC